MTSGFWGCKTGWCYPWRWGKHIAASDLASLCLWDIEEEVACRQIQICGLERRLELKM